MASYSKEKRLQNDLITRDSKKRNYPGIATFLGLRAADPFLQYQILRNDWGSTLITRAGGTTLPRGPPLVTNTFLDHVIGLSPYRTIILAMAAGSMIKQNFTTLFLMNEEITPAASAAVGAANTTFNSLNSLFFICSQTSASVNGEHFPQTPLILGASMYVIGMILEQGSELQRAAFKKDPANKGKVYTGGLFGLSRHINYFGYTLWRAGYALAAGGWIWGAINAAGFSYEFLGRAIPVLQGYCEDKYGEQYKAYEEAVPYRFVPYLI